MNNESIHNVQGEDLDASEQGFQDQLSHEILLSERLRTTILASVFSFGFVWSVLIFLRIYQLEVLGLSMLGVLSVVVIIAILVLYELLIRFMIGRRIKQEKPPPRGVWYVNAFIETSFPTVMLLLARRNAESPIIVLTSPIVFMYFIFIILSTLRLDSRLSLFTGVVAVVEYIVFSVHTLGHLPANLEIEPILRLPIFYLPKAINLLIGGVGAAFVAREIRRRIINSFKMIEERNQILNVFGQQTAPAIVEELLQGGTDTSSQRKHVCIMFLDIRGFTAFSERRPPEEVVSYLNTLFDFMIDIVHQHHGIIPQLLGDGFMAIFGAPLSHDNDSQNGVNAALAIIDRIASENRAGHIPSTRVGIGLHAGEGLVGIVGSAIHKEYKVTGDVINLASRIEQLNKDLNSQLLISEAVWNDVTLDEESVIGEQMVEIRGRSRPVRIYQLA